MARNQGGTEENSGHQTGDLDRHLVPEPAHSHDGDGKDTPGVLDSRCDHDPVKQVSAACVFGAEHEREDLAPGDGGRDHPGGTEDRADGEQAQT